MAQQVQELIDKIKAEGIEAAQKHAHEIETDAHKHAEQIISEAKSKAKAIVDQANQEAKTTKESSQKALQQAARDMLLTLRKEIEFLFNGIIRTEVSQSLSSEKLSSIIAKVIEGYLKSNDDGGEIHVDISEQDWKSLKDSMLSELKKKIKNPIVVKPSSNIGAGFSISFDAGKSRFEFTDESIAEFLSSRLNPQISELIQNHPDKA